MDEKRISIELTADEWFILIGCLVGFPTQPQVKRIKLGIVDQLVNRLIPETQRVHGE